MVYGRYNELVHGFINQLITGGAPATIGNLTVSEWDIVGIEWRYDC
jgi:hypothetical protein